MPSAWCRNSSIGPTKRPSLQQTTAVPMDVASNGAWISNVVDFVITMMNPLPSGNSKNPADNFASSFLSVGMPIAD
jgi:hypothetical protein